MRRNFRATLASKIRFLIRSLNWSLASSAFASTKYRAVLMIDPAPLFHDSFSRVTSLARVDVVGPLRGEPLELVYLGVRVAFRFVVVLNPVDQELLDALLGKVRILLIDMPHGLVEIQRP